MATYDNIVNQIKELTFDRFVTPTMFIRSKNGTDVSVSIAADKLVVTKGNTPTDYLFTTYPTLDSLITGLMASPHVEVVYSGSFIPSELSTTLVAKSSTNVSSYVPVFRSSYFSGKYFEKWFKEYVILILFKDGDLVKDFDSEDWDSEFQESVFDAEREKHFVLWVAYNVVGDRRLYELASQNLLRSTLGGHPEQNVALDGIDNTSFSPNNPGSDLQVNIGDTFTLSQTANSSIGLYNDGEIPKDMLPPWMVGSDNVLMDYYSFWYRLQLFLRERFELVTGDQSLRKNTVVNGRIALDPRSSNKFYSYFDSYPWVFSPYLRGIPNVDVQNLRT